MSQIKILNLTSSGDLKATESWLRKLLRIDLQSVLDKYGKKGVKALAAATPKRTGLTANSWNYRSTIKHNAEGGVASASLEFYNTNLSTSADKIPIVILIEYGHGTRNGGYVPPHPFVSKATKEVFDNLAKELWKEVKEV